jgi:hypothetical protein
LTLICIGVEGRRHFLLCACDTCNKQFKTYRYKLRYKRYHFDSRECSNAAQKNGVLAQQVKETNLQKYGVEFPQQDAEVVARRVQTNIMRYGTPDPRRIGLERVLAEAGVVNASQLAGHKGKVEATSLERYGVKHPFQADVVKAKSERTCLVRYGVKHYPQSDDFLLKMNLTCQENLGVDWPMQSSAVKSKVDWLDCARRRHATMKEKGLYRSSAAEDRFYQLLVDKFGIDDVERQVIVNDRWPVDFYVQSLDAYVQYDGAYRHGQDRELVDIIPGVGHGDAIIKQIAFDKHQNSWFAQAGLRLARFISVASAARPTQTDDFEQFIQRIQLSNEPIVLYYEQGLEFVRQRNALKRRTNKWP